MTSVAVVGATGFTGRKVAHELVRRGANVLLVGRNEAALTVLAGGLRSAVDVAVADLGDTEALAAAVDTVAVVVNCAGPFVRCGPPVIEAALSAGRDYVDTSAEQRFIASLFDDVDERARARGITVVPSAGFFHLPAEATVRDLLSGMDEATEVDVVYAVRGWNFTPASTEAIGLSAGQSFLRYRKGHWVPSDAPESTQRTTDAPDCEAVFEFPGGEIMTLPRVARLRDLRVWMTSSTFASLGSDGDPAVGDTSSFAIHVTVLGAGWRRAATMRGREIYSVTAPLAAEVACRLAAGVGRNRSGVIAPSEFCGLSRVLELGAPYELEFDGSYHSEAGDS